MVVFGTASWETLPMSISLRPAALSDRKKIFRWLAKSDATPEMMGPPNFGDHPVPTFEEFCADYDETAYSSGGCLRLFVIVSGQQEIGAISYFTRDQVAELDIWIGSRSDWGRGHGSRAIEIVAGLLKERGDVSALIIRPSARNTRAVSAYRKSGFQPHDPDSQDLPGWCQDEGLDYADAVLLVRGIAKKSNPPIPE